LKANFEKAWNRFDINSDGFIRAEETHTFMRSLMGKLNKFALAPGSLSDIGNSSPSFIASPAPAPKPKKLNLVAKKKAPVEDEDTSAAAVDPETANVEIETPAGLE